MSCTLTASFLPAGPHPSSATLRVASNDAFAPYRDIHLSGTCISEASLVVDPDSLDFGPVSLASDPVTMDLTLVNVGSESLELHSLEVVPVHGGTFGIATGHPGYCGNPPITFSPGISCVVRVAFDPAAAGPAEALLRIASNDADSSVRDVPLSGEGAGPRFSDDFSDGSGGVDPHWTVTQGSRRVTRTEEYSSVPAHRDQAVVAQFDPRQNPVETGTIVARVKLLPFFVTEPNARIVFDWRDKGHYRYVHLGPGRVRLGQSGAYGGERAGVKKTVPWRLATKKWYTVRIDVRAGGLVQVFIDGAPLAPYPFAEAAPGGVGVMALKARSLFDDFTVW